jgi:hypothetical protein
LLNSISVWLSVVSGGSLLLQTGSTVICSQPIRKHGYIIRSEIPEASFQGAVF